MNRQSTIDTETPQPSPPPAPRRFGPAARLATTVAAALALAGVAVGYAQLRSSAKAPEAPATSEAVSLAPGPRLLTLTSTGQVTMVDRNDPGGTRAVSKTKCDRVYAAAGTAACLFADGVLGKVTMRILDADLKERKAIPVSGVPNRVRVSASGRMVSWTAFVGGDSYATLNFATRTGIYDSRTGTLFKTLETFSVIKDGKPYQSLDVNYWGVTFTDDDNTFYATMYTKGHRYLVQGDFAARSVRTLRDRVECPSLSPDGTRIAFKAPIDGDSTRGWRLSVLDLATDRVTRTAETRSVDDQAAWLDDSTLSYVQQHDDGTKDLWSVAADGSGKPRLLLRNAHSPAALG
ncbi:TolB family protein [Streptomyces sp. NPDC059010]|uniref:TolB family protein n=1 Tax=Streptomyces sp. NPDC059010 TaxID=3346695 RepID=UPI00367FF59A